MRFIFLIDPWETLHRTKDTSLLWIAEALHRLHDVYVCFPGRISVRPGGKVVFKACRVLLDQNKAAELPDNERRITHGALRISGPSEDILAESGDAVLVRWDPPMNELYLHQMQMLDLLPTSVYVINRPRGICLVGEKLWPMRFSDMVPDTAVTTSIDRYLSFLHTYRRIIIKPIDQFGGMSVFRVAYGDVNRRVIFETMTHGGKRPVILQPFLPEAECGDKRILLLDGEILGAVLRVHAEGEHRNNFASGGMPEKAGITDRDREIVRTIAPYLRQEGIDFAGIDIIGGMLIEVNVTSPTCLREINRLGECHLEKDIVDFIENRTRRHSDPNRP